MSDLITWLRAQLDEDEQNANLIPGGGYLPARWTAHRVPDGEWSEIRQHDRPSEDDWEEVSTAGLMTWGRNEDLHVTRWDPARVIREVEAKRAILNEHDQALKQRRDHPEDMATTGWLLGTLRAIHILATSYDDRPGYLDEWRPAEVTRTAITDE